MLVIDALATPECCKDIGRLAWHRRRIGTQTLRTAQLQWCPRAQPPAAIRLLEAGIARLVVEPDDAFLLLQHMENDGKCQAGIHVLEWW